LFVLRGRAQLCTYGRRRCRTGGCDRVFARVEAISDVVGDTGFEPVTSSVSRKRATAAPIARAARWVRDSNPCIRLCRPLPRLSANPPGDDVRPVVSILGPPPPSG